MSADQNQLLVLIGAVCVICGRIPLMNPIVGIGELLWDVYPDRKVAGGAPFNFAFHCHQLGHPAAIVSRVGADELGRELRERVRELGLSDEFIQTDHEHPTGTVQVTLGAEGVPAYTITENVAWDHLAWDEKLEPLLKSCQAVCFGTLAQRFGTPVPIHRFVTGERDRWGYRRLYPQLVVFDVNLRGSYFNDDILWWGLSECDWRKINGDELDTISQLFGWSALSDLVDWARTETSSGCGTAVLTRGENGCDIYRVWEEGDGDGGESFLNEAFHVPGVPANVVDTVGAGDAFTAAMVCLHLEGKSLREAAVFAVHYASRVCEHPGGTPRIDRAEVERAASLMR